MSRSPQKTPKNLYKTLILTNFSIHFTHLHYIAVSQIGFEPHSKSLRDCGEPFQMSRSRWRTQAIGFEPHSKSLRDYGEPFLCTDRGGEPKRSDSNHIPNRCAIMENRFKWADRVSRHKAGGKCPLLCVWPTRSDSNRWPSESESDALSSWATGSYWFAYVLYHKFIEL